MLKFVAADIIHPPLFYALVKVWIGVGGESLLWLRLLPALISVATIVPFFLLARELNLRSSELNLALLLMAVNGYLIKYAQELRMYGLLLFFAVTSLWLFVRFVNSKTDSKKQLVSLFAVNLLLAYTHYYGWTVLLVEGLALLLWWRHRLRAFLVSLGTLVLSYLPWIYLVTISAEQGRGLAQNIGWVTRPNARDVCEFLSMLSVPFFSLRSNATSFNDFVIGSIVFVLFGLPLLAFLWRAYKQRRAEGGEPLPVLWLLLFSFVPLVLVFVLSWILPHSIWGSRHLIITAVPYSVLIAMALTRLRPAWLKATCLVIVSVWFFLAGTVLLLRPAPVFIWCAWESLAQQMLNSQPRSARVVQVYAFEDLVAYHLWFTLETAQRSVNPDNFKVTVIKGVPGLQEDPAYFLPRRFDEIEEQNGAKLRGDQVWVAFRDRDWNEQRTPLNTIEEQGYRVGRILEFPAQGQKAFLVEFLASVSEQ